MRGCHVVEQDDVGSRLRRNPRIRRSFDLDFEFSGEGHSLAEVRNRLAQAQLRDVIVLYHHHVREVEAVGIAPASDHGTLLYASESGRRLSSRRDSDVVAHLASGIHRIPRQRRDTGGMTDEIHGDPFASEHVTSLAGDLQHNVTGLDAVADRSRGFDADAEILEDGGRSFDTSDDASFFGDEPTGRFAGNLVGYVVVAEVLCEPPFDRARLNHRLAGTSHSGSSETTKCVPTDSRFSLAARAMSSAVIAAFRSSYSDREVRVRV